MIRQPKAPRKITGRPARPVDPALKTLTEAALRSRRARWRRQGLRVGLTNGCFDLLHRGHVTYLCQARRLCDILVVAVNSDVSVRALNKGPNRPLNTEADRAFVLAGLACVDAVVVFGEPTVTRIISLLRPDLYFKGGDYTLDTLNPDEKAAVLAGGGRIRLIPLVPGKSTTGLVKKMRS